MRPCNFGHSSQPLALVLLDGGRKKGIIVKPVYIHNYGLAPGVVVFQAFWATLGCHLSREFRRHVPVFRGFWGSLNEWSLLTQEFRVSESISWGGGKRPPIVNTRFWLCRLAGARRHSPP